jgi:ParB-like chromosome segregation protein Spo0J
VVSGNHRFMAACELKMTHVACVVSKMTGRAAKRLAINLNTIHGEPNAELLAPFLAELDLDLLSEIHIDDDMKAKLMDFDDVLAASLAKLEAPEKMNRKSLGIYTAVCKCPKCGAQHVKKTKV